jgi:Putative prokaryotic signal transducing protein
MTIDPEKERGRLSEFYASKTDEELGEIATHPRDLTDIAVEALRNEMGKRRLSLQQAEVPEENQENLDFRDLVTIRSYWGLLEAEMAKGLLDSAGIESFLFDDNIVRMDWFNAIALGGVKLLVDPQNVDAANHILRETAEEAAAAEIDSEDTESTT